MNNPNVMLCHSYDKHKSKIKFPCYVQTKYDGCRMIWTPNHGFVTRNGKPMFLWGLQEIMESISHKLSYQHVFDGELVFEGCDRQTSNGLALKAQKNNLTLEEQNLARFHVWDMIWYNRYLAGSLNESYQMRLERLTELCRGNVIAALTWTCNNEDEINQLYKWHLGLGLEGIVVKNMEGFWEAKRSYDCLKMKAEKTCELRAKVFMEGQGKYFNTLGSIEFSNDEGTIIVSVGGGFTDADRYNIWNDLAKYINRIATIRYNQVITNLNNPGIKSLYLPRFVEWRFDTNTTSRLEEI